MSQQDANKWAANFVANLSQVANATGDVDAFARSIDEYLGDGTVSNAQEMRDRVEGTDAEERVDQILSDYENNSQTPGLTEIKRLIVEKSDAGQDDASDLSGDALDDALMTALSEFGQKWQNNYSSAFGY